LVSEHSHERRRAGRAGGYRSRGIGGLHVNASAGRRDN
jgi:hypothetical protein